MFTFEELEESISKLQDGARVVYVEYESRGRACWSRSGAVSAPPGYVAETAEGDTL